MTRCDLYRYFDAAGRLLYVGVSISAVARFGTHKAMKRASWVGAVRKITIENFASRDLALAAEAAAISGEAPRHNKELVACSAPLRPRRAYMRNYMRKVYRPRLRARSRRAAAVK